MKKKDIMICYYGVKVKRSFFTIFALKYKKNYYVLKEQESLKYINYLEIISKNEVNFDIENYFHLSLFVWFFLKTRKFIVCKKITKEILILLLKK